MCSVAPDVMTKLTDTVKQFLDEGRMFTGYDVTLETRQREQMHLRHQDVRGAVHEIDVLNDALDFGWDTANGTVNWSKAQVAMPGGGWAFVYHPAHLDPKNYQPRTQPGQSQPSPMPVSKPTASISVAKDGAIADSGGEQDDGTFATDYRNRLLVPTRFLKEAGMNPGDTVYVIPDPGTHTVILAKDTDALQTDGVKITTQRVERNGDVRLSSTTLKAADLADNKFVIGSTEKGDTSTKIKVVEVKRS